MVVKQMDPHRLVLKLMDPGWMKAYADDHPNELAVSGDKDSMLVTAKTEDFQAFLLRHAKDDAAFGNDAIFVRPGDPTTRATTAPATSPTTGP
jgi:hypothetical protein